jgi:hypothetical protein
MSFDRRAFAALALRRRLVALAGRLECERDPTLDQLYPAHFAGWVAAEENGRVGRVACSRTRQSAAGSLSGGADTRIGTINCEPTDAPRK